jgi:hypothetical protein
MEGRLADLSVQAIRTTAALPISDAMTLARRLYAYGSVPRSPHIERDFGPGDDALQVLGLGSGGAVRSQLLRVYDAFTHPGWIAFTRTASEPRRAPRFKLYVSPRPEALARAFPIIADVFSNQDVRSFKVGRGVPGLLRPDKIVSYFDDWLHLASVADGLGKALAGCAAQGAPFTAALDRQGLLSWGMDPPPLGANGQVASWRSWVTGQVAAAIIAVRGPRQDPAGPVLERLAAQGVVGWRPTVSADKP